jgi:hypothetical protein
MCCVNSTRLVFLGWTVTAFGHIWDWERVDRVSRAENWDIQADSEVPALLFVYQGFDI